VFFETSRKSTVEEYIEVINDIGRKWLQHTKGDLIYAIDFHDGSHTAFRYKVLTDGKVPSFRLKPISKLTGPDAKLASTTSA
jgi:hypothetical protein